MPCRRALGEAAEASAPALSGRDRVLEALLVDVGVDRGGADVGVAGELADHLDRLAGVGEMRAERVAQDVFVPTSAQAYLSSPAIRVSATSMTGPF